MNRGLFSGWPHGRGKEMGEGLFWREAVPPLLGTGPNADNTEAVFGNWRNLVDANPSFTIHRFGWAIDPSGLVRLRGVVTPTQTSPLATLLTLPGHAAPERTEMFAVQAASNGAARLTRPLRCDVNPSGTVVITIDGAPITFNSVGSDWVSLSGISYQVREQQ